MRWRAACVSILIAAVVATNASGEDSLDAIDGCIRHLDPQADVGYERIAARCPDLTRRLETSSWTAWLPRDWKESSYDLSASSLRELRSLVARELATRTTPRTPRLAPLNAILSELGPMEPREMGPWTRFNRWLREALERDDPSTGGDWLDRMLARVGPSQAVIDLLCYAGLAVVVAMAGVLIANELRVAGVFTSRRRRASPGAGPGSRTSGPSDWDTIERAATRDRPRLLLDLIAARLTELNRLPPAGGLTVRELVQKARVGGDEERALLADVALAAERVRFSGEPIPTARLDVAVERGRQLLERLA
jgi:hypothetical protein